jgi:uncharacterized protein (DUF1501 family)
MIYDSYEAAMHELSVVDTTDDGLSRRQLMKAALAAGSAAAIGVGAGATIGGGAAHAAVKGNLLLIQLGGGNDGFNTLPPMTGTPATLYRQFRPQIYIQNPIPARLSGGKASGFGFHPSLQYVASRYKAGRVAVVRGVGFANSSLSHFECILTWFAGTGLPGAPTSGWIGRWLDTFPTPGLVDAVQIGPAVPLHMVGTTRKASSIDVWEADFGSSDDGTEQLMFNALRGYGASPNARGALADKMIGATTSMMAINKTVSPLYSTPTELPDQDIVGKLTLAARLFNTGLGVRVISTGMGDFDQHDDEPGTHADNLARLDNALKAFFTSLKPGLRNRTTVMTFSEFGRKPHANESRGTDHGRPSVMFVMGEKVKGGMYGAHPSFAGLEEWDDAVPTVDFRSVYSAILKTWLKANPLAIVGKSYPKLSLFRSGPT